MRDPDEECRQRERENGSREQRERERGDREIERGGKKE